MTRELGPPRYASAMAIYGPTVIPANVKIEHEQLRDLIICPRQKGVLNCVQSRAIVEHSVDSNYSRTLVNLDFTPNTLTSIQVNGDEHTLLASGGQHAELHLSLYSNSTVATRAPFGGRLWTFDTQLPGTINNSILLTSLGSLASNPRILISNNDHSIKFYDIYVRGEDSPKEIAECGELRLNMPVNHSSISPDGQVLLSVGDSSKLHLHHLTGGSRVTFSPISTIDIPPPTTASWLPASFSTSWSANGSKFAVASQEGVVAIWDVRSSKPLKVLHTDKTRLPTRTLDNDASGYITDDPREWTPYNATGWSVRTVKFGSGGANGKEILAFAEHSNWLHILDARTFENEEVIRVPNAPKKRPQRLAAPRTRSASPARLLTTSHNAPLPSSITWSGPGGHRRQAERDAVIQNPVVDDARHTNSSRRESRSFVGTTLQHETVEPVSSEIEVDGFLDSRDFELDVIDSRDFDCLRHSRPSSPSSQSSSRVAPSFSQDWYKDYHHYDPNDQSTSKSPHHDVDIAGMCFSPETGAFLYVATSHGIAEYAIRDSEKKWWGSHGFV